MTTEHLDLTGRVMLVSLSISVFSGERQDRDVTEEVAKTHQTVASMAGNYRKKIISPHALKPIKSAANAARIKHATLTLPWSDTGTRLLSVTQFFKYKEEMGKLALEFEREVDVFIKAYPDLIEEARKRLNGMFDIEDYPPISELRARFSYQTWMEPLPTGRNWFLELADDEVIELQKRAESRLETRVAEAVQDTFRRIGTVCEHMVERLDAYSDIDAETGKPRGVFRDSLVENIRELVDLLPGLNITNDQRISDLASEMKSKLGKWDAGALRVDHDIRKETRDAAADILTRVQGMFA